MIPKREAGTPFRLAGREIVAFALGTTLLAAGAAFVALANTGGDHRVFTAVADAVTIVILMAVGLFAWRRDQVSTFGRLLMLTGFGWFLVSLSASDSDLLYTVGRVSTWGEELLLIYLFLSYPSGRLQTSGSAVVFAASCALVALLFVPTAFLVQHYPVHAPYALCSSDCPGNAFALTSSTPGFIGSVVIPVRELLTGLAFLSVAVILAMRLRAATPAMRRTLAPVLAAAAFGMGTALVYMVARRSGGFDQAALAAIAAVRGLTTPLAALGFLFGLVIWQLQEARVLERLALASPGSATPVELEAMLADAFDDPTLEVRYRTPGGAVGWYDCDGVETAAPTESNDRCVVEIGEAENVRAAIICDPALKGQRRLVEAAGSWIGASLEHQRLSALLSASLRDVESSRRRLATATASERRRIERDLHDGAQQRLVTLRIQLELAAEALKHDPASGAQRLRDLGPSVDGVIDEVRSLARGIYPAILADAGLEEALRAVAAREVMSVTVKAERAVRYPLEIESAVYFCCLEALQNAAKHSGAPSVSISLVSRQDELEFEVKDLGTGFVPSNGNGGAGLTNMRDRLAAVGGALVIDSSPQNGTRVTGEVPARALL